MSPGPTFNEVLPRSHDTFVSVWQASLFVVFALMSAITLGAELRPAPEWVAKMEPGTWVAISVNTLSDVDPEKDPDANPNHPGNAPWHGSTGQSSVIDARNGGAFASAHGESGSLILYGGGHGNYFGSEVYAFDLATRMWSRLTNPYPGPFNWPYPTAEYPDGSAIPPHTYDFVDYHPATNSFVLLKGQTELGPPSNYTAVAIAHMFDLTKRQWRRGPLSSGINIFSGGYSAYDSRRDVYWTEGGSGSNAFMRFDPKPVNADGTFGRWDQYSMKSGMTDSAAAYDPVRDLFVYTAFRESSNIYAIPLDKPESGRVQLREAGTPPVKRSASAWEWSESRRGFIYYAEGDGVYEFVLDGADWQNDNWVWRRITSASNSVIPQSMTVETGVYSRFRIAHFSDAEIALVVNRTDGPVYAFRIGSSPHPNPPASLKVD